MVSERGNAMHCRCVDASCLDRGVACGECDEDGYATSARRRLKRRADGTVQDIDDQQVFKVKKTKTGVRLVPIFGRIDWKGAQGFAAMRLLLSCLGADGEYVLWDSEKNEEMDVAGWRKRKYRSKSKLSVWHWVCKETVTSTSISSLTHKGQSIGCSCNLSLANHWRHRRAEVALMGKERGFMVVTDEKEWLKTCTGCDYCPIFHCIKCNETVTSTCISSLRQGQSIGCSCNLSSAQHWCHRRSEVVCMGEERGFVVVTNEEEWLKACTGKGYCPTFRCKKCDETVTSSTINHLRWGRSIGCSCNLNSAKHWRYRRSEVVLIGEERGFVVVTDEEEWRNGCTGKEYCPTFRCIKCNKTVTSTSVHSLSSGQSIGCHCRKRTEGKLFDWLNERFPPESGVIVSTQYRGPKTTRDHWTHFDFYLTFPDGFEVLVELDGAQHFWISNGWHTDDGCERDLLKEEWAVQRGLCVIRVLQEDVWYDRLDWQGWLVRSIAAARSGEPQPITPDAPEYRSHESAYVRLRDHSCNGL